MRAHARAEARLAEYRQSEAYQDLVAGLVAASGVPISQVVAKPPKARDPEAVKAVQTKIEQRRNDKPKEERRTPTPPGWGSPFTSPFVSGPMDLGPDLALEEVENQSLMIPLDPRVFTAATMEVVKAGKFERRHARNIQGFMGGCIRLLDLDCGIGFVALRARAGNPEIEVTLHEERPALSGFARRLVARNFADAQGIGFSGATLNPGGDWAGLGALVAEVKPQVLRISGPMLPVEALTEAHLQGVRRVLIPFLDPSEITALRGKQVPVLLALGFVEDMNGEANGTICLSRQ